MSKIENIYEHPNYYSLEDFDGEVWKQVPGVHPEYFVSNLGRLKNIGGGSRGTGKGQYARPRRILKPTIQNGYAKVRLTGDITIQQLHHAVALAFIGPRPSPKHGVNHKNARPLDNRPENLEWATHDENMAHAVSMGLVKQKRGIEFRLSVQVAQYSEDGNILNVYGSITEAAAPIGRGCSSIQRAILGNLPAAHGFIWKKITKEEYFKLKAELEG